MHVTTAIPIPARPDPFGGIKGLVGKTFMHPAIDYLLVGGGITIPIFVAVYFYPQLASVDTRISIYTFILINGAHFAASTLRLYTKPGAKEEFPFLSWGFPVICLLVVGMGLYWETLGKNLTALYLSWSPYHYAAQAYGVAVMYAMRSGAKLDQRDKNLIWWVCLLPFVFALLTASDRGLAWLVSPERLASIPLLPAFHRGMVALVEHWVFRIAGSALLAASSTAREERSADRAAAPGDQRHLVVDGRLSRRVLVVGHPPLHSVHGHRRRTTREGANGEGQSGPGSPASTGVLHHQLLRDVVRARRIPLLRRADGVPPTRVYALAERADDDRDHQPASFHRRWIHLANQASQTRHSRIPTRCPRRYLR